MSASPSSGSGRVAPPAAASAACRSGLTVALIGPSCSGKTSVAAGLQETRAAGCPLAVVAQDNYYRPEEHIAARVHGPQAAAGGHVVAGNSHQTLVDWDCLEAIDHDALRAAITEAKKDGAQLVVVEGTMLTELPGVRELVDVVLILDADKTTCRERRLVRNYDGNPDPPWYFDEIVWPRWEQVRAAAVAGGASRVLEPAPALLDTVAQAAALLEALLESQGTDHTQAHVH